jgi:tetratricopeptide (TPR) repeat protein
MTLFKNRFVLFFLPYVFLATFFFAMTRWNVFEIGTNLMQGAPKPGAEAKALEAKVADHPNDLKLREEILSYYLTRQYRERWAKQARRDHIFWVIQNHPGSELAGTGYMSLMKRDDGSSYRRASEMWEEQIRRHPTETKVLGNAGNFFLLEDSQRAEKYFLKCVEIEPDNPKWPSCLAHLYSLEMMDRGDRERKVLARKALEQEEKSSTLDSPENRVNHLSELAKLAYAAEVPEKAKKFASEAVEVKPESNNYGECLHHGNLILGQLALQDNDIVSARRYLLQAGKTPGSPTLDSFGPNMTLAKMLLEKGERQVVLDYLDLCAKFWESGREDRLPQWKRTVKQGGIPDFGANLVY